jgi:selenocysteine-specific elongation factor
MSDSSDRAPARFAIVGTAGHIDHGKSTLVRALTGIDPDRLPEEKARGMTIELGFAHLDLPGVRLGVVDVPGHERFVRTMVAGATGIDLAMLVVAADDGVMPQTHEHIEILDLLGVTRGLVVISKADAAPAERIGDVRRQVRAAVAGTALQEWRHVVASAVRGDGLDELRSALAATAREVPRTRESALFRMAIDRVFSVK